MTLTAVLTFLAAVLPSIITGLTPYASATKVLYWLKFICDILSVVTHKDSPASLKMPGKRSRCPNAPTKMPDSPSVKPLVMLLPLLLIMSSCSWWQKVQDPALACAKDEIQSKLPNLAPLVADILEIGANWQADLTSLAQALGAYGMDIVRCTVASLLGEAPPMAKRGAPKAALSPDARKRGAAWLLQ